MKIALVTTLNPRARGGAEVLYDGLFEALVHAGHAVERVELMVDEATFDFIIEGYHAAARLDLSGFDLVISTKAPSYNIRHPNHVLYLIHTVRVFYDMFESWTDGSEVSKALRDRIQHFDLAAISRIPEAKRFAIGEEVAVRLQKHLGLSAKVLHPALADASRFHDGPFEHFLLAGRLHRWKRPELVLDAYLRLDCDIPLLITGSGEEEGRLRELAGDRRVVFLGDVPREQLYDLFSKALAVPFVPVHEDFGYVAVEAMLAGKPVITVDDAGEPARLVARSGGGLVVDPTPEAVSTALRHFVDHPSAASDLGARGKSFARGIQWDKIVGELLEAGRTSARSSVFLSNAPRRPIRVVIADNQPIEPPVGGGRLRLHGLYSNLPAHFDPVYVGTYDWRGPGFRTFLHKERLLEITVPQSEAHFQAHDALRGLDSRLTMDVTFPILASLSENYVERLAAEARRADVIVLSHPWAFPAISRIPGISTIPLVYDAQNVEGQLRRSILGVEGFAGEIASTVEKVESEFCRRADAILCCSPEDAEEFVLRYGVDRNRIHVVPNGVDTEAQFPPGPHQRQEARERHRLAPQDIAAVFIGSGYAPNAEAARYIVEQLAPAVPEVTFLVAGGCCDSLAGVAQVKNVRLLGALPNEERNAVYAAADLAVNPMLRGSGTNIKMLDFLAAGLPAISTPMGARGLSAGGVENGILVSAIETFPEEVRRVANDPKLRQQLGASGRKLAETDFNWRHISLDVARILRDLVSRDHDGSAAVAGPEEEAGPPALAILSTWKTQCGIAAYTEFLAESLPPSVNWKIYAESASCSVSDGPSVSRNWSIGMLDFSGLVRSFRLDRPEMLLIQHNPAFVGPVRFRQLLQLTRESKIRASVILHAVREIRVDPDLRKELDLVHRIYVHRSSDAEWLANEGVAGEIRVLRHGVPKMLDRPTEDLKIQLGLRGTTVVGHFGYLRPHKGTLELIDAFNLLARDRPDLHLVLLCSTYPSDDSREYQRACETRIHGSPFRSRIHENFEPLDLEEIGLILQACDLLVFPYLPSQESSSAAVRVGAAAGRPILVSESMIFEELRGTVETVGSVEPEALAERIRELLQDPRALAECRAKVRNFARLHEWSSISAFVARDLGFLVPGTEGVSG